MSSPQLSIFVFFCFLCFTSSCFAYDIKLCSGESNLPSQGILNLVFCPLHYEDKEVFLKDIDALIAKLSKVKPFDEFIKELAFYYVVLSKEEENLIFKKNVEGFPPLEVRQDFLDDISAYFKSNYKLIILDAAGGVSCAELSSIDKTSLVILGRRRYRNKTSFAKGFLHELGHCLGLRDECVDCSQLCSPGPPNCATTEEEAKNWWGDLVGSTSRVRYIGGCCGNKDYIRPTIASLMNDPDKAEDFGPVNERYLRKVLEGVENK